MKLVQNAPVIDPIPISEAALLLGRSERWVRAYRQVGALAAAEIEGRQAVTRHSVDLMRTALAAGERARSPKIVRARRRQGHLKLIVDNT
ncbi:hypothetical protein GGE45_003574 [Rhizobium aethiopicum]|uniref:Helix-turn-helix domain-containing protein n=1 Tax=Rhizobium aethiopicum TaxID=1138170 RepID=A0A7W6QAN0_9HYPH|nr:hypothetical protein [Rhizobium aethiopicum]MBB4194049.1 hypothetical protein [Rhizobium aethiopicum]MBB4581230.1 hypothetical protein [Rhizobium aethiopicum]